MIGDMDPMKSILPQVLTLLTIMSFDKIAYNMNRRCGIIINVSSVLILFAYKKLASYR